MTTRLDAVPNTQDVDPWRRRADYLLALGLKGETFEAPSAGVGLAPTSQTIFASSWYLYAGETVTNLVVETVVAGVGAAPATIKLSLWEVAGGPIARAVTANLAGDVGWTNTPGYKVYALGTPFVVGASGLFYPAVLKDGAFATTDVQLLAGALSSRASDAVPTGNPRRFPKLGTAKTDVLVGDTATLTGPSQPIWFGWN